MGHYFSRLRILLSFMLRDVSKSRFVLIFTIVSLSTAFTAVFLSAGILDGFQAMLKNGATDSMGHIILYPREGDDHIAGAEEIAENARQTQNVRAVSLRDRGEAIIEYAETKLGPLVLLGTDAEQESQTTKLPEDVVQGRFLNADDSQSVVLGLTLADALVGLEYDGKKIPIGDKVTLANNNGEQKKYTVVGILDGKTFAPNWVMYLTKEEMDRFEPQKKNNQIAVKIKDPLQLEKTRKIIQSNNPEIEALTWQEEGGYIADMVSATKFVTGSISGLLVLAVFVIMSVIIFINVFQRRRQIGILKSMGASNRFIVVIYVLEALTYSMISFIIGFLFFMLIHIHSMNNPIYTLIGDFHTEFNPQDILPSLIALVLASMGGSLFPALSAARTRIADVIRGNV